MPALVADLLDTLHASPGVALAAPQIGHLVQIIAVDVTRKKGEKSHGLVVLLNPRILSQEQPRMIRGRLSQRTGLHWPSCPVRADDRGRDHA